MPSLLRLDQKSTVLLIEDYQNAIVEGFAPDRDALLKRTASVLHGARRAGIPVIYVKVCFREGYPEVLPEVRQRDPKRFSNRRMVEGTPGAEIHPDVAPEPGEVVVTKRRTGPFSTTDVNAVLHALGARTLAVMGVATSGCVLSTVRWAADIDYSLVVISDCCADPDPEVHRVLTEKVFPRQAAVVTAQEFLAALS